MAWIESSKIPPYLAPCQNCGFTCWMGDLTVAKIIPGKEAPKSFCMDCSSSVKTLLKKGHKIHEVSTNVTSKDLRELVFHVTG